jgi:lactate dehydrogenase-like 2-hydroxyacid dehydrogenase
MTVALLTDADGFPSDEEDRRTLENAGVELRELAGHDPDELVAAARGADAIFVYHAKVPRATIEQLEGCRVLARCGTGYDNIDVAAAREHGIEVVFVPDYGADDVADHALALLLACWRKVVLAEEEQPLPVGHPLRDCPTAVFTPHAAAYSEEALAEVRKRPLADTLRVLRGERPKDPVPV